MDRLVRCVAGVCSPVGLRRFHLLMTVVWALTVIPAFVWDWKSSVPFIAFASIYANFASEFAAYQASRVEVKQSEEEGP